MNASSRLQSLDILRGITVAAMIVVNNPGSSATRFALLRHSYWNGCTPTDLVFPFFVFCMGLSMYISHRKHNFSLSWQAVGRTLLRGLLIIAIGWALDWFAMAVRHLAAGDELLYSLVTYPFANLRYLGILPRLGVVSAFAGILLLLFKPKRTPYVAAALLAVYCILQSVTNSFELNAENILSQVDLRILGYDHMYHQHGEPFDPEGILSTIPVIGHCLLGAFAGHLLFGRNDKIEKSNVLFLLGTITLLSGFLLDYAYPINKPMWSASYVLLTTGLASLLLGLLLWIVDVKGYLRWSYVFRCFGANPLFLYCMSAVIVALTRAFMVNVAGETHNLYRGFYYAFAQPLLGDYWGSLFCPLVLLTICGVVAHILYKRQIYIKL